MKKKIIALVLSVCVVSGLILSFPVEAEKEEEVPIIQTDAKGEEEVDENLPVTMQVHYYLNEQEMSAEQMAGVSGRVKIRFDYENHTNVPFMAMTAVMLPEDVFANVEVSDGEIITYDEYSIAAGMAFPGLAKNLGLADNELTEEIEVADSVEITADVQEFELDFTATVVTTIGLSEMDTEDLDEIDELVDSMDELEDISGQLVKGMGTLTEGLGEMQTYMNAYTQGIAELQSGMTEMSNKLTSLEFPDENTLQELNDAVTSIKSENEVLATKLQTLMTTLADMDTKATDAARMQAASEVEEALIGLVAAGTLTEEQKAAVASAVQYGDIKIEGLVTDIGILTEINTSIANIQAQVDMLNTNVDEISVLLESAGMMEGMTTNLTTVIQSLSEGLPELNSGMSGLVQLASALNSGVVAFDEEGIQKLTELAGDDLSTLVQNIRALKQAEIDYSNQTDAKERYVLETEKIAGES